MKDAAPDNPEREADLKAWAVDFWVLRDERDRFQAELLALKKRVTILEGRGFKGIEAAMNRLRD
jgi:hypothetical protein